MVKYKTGILFPAVKFSKPGCEVFDFMRLKKKIRAGNYIPVSDTGSDFSSPASYTSVAYLLVKMMNGT